MIDFACPGDTIVVWRLDRLGRSLKHLIKTAMGLQTRGINFRSLVVSLDDLLPLSELRSSELTLIICGCIGAERRSSHIMTEHGDTSTSEGKFTFHLFGAFAEMERDVIRQRAKSGLEAARRR